MMASKTAKSSSFLAHRLHDGPSTRKNVAARNFKVLTESEKPQLDADTKKHVVGFRKDATLNSSNASKVELKNIENCKGKSVSSVVGRKPLADVSNLARQASKYMYLGRVKVAQSAARTANVSTRKPLMGKLRDSQGVSHTLTRGNSNNLKAPSEDKEAKCTGREFTINNSRRSLPVLRRVSKAETTTAKKIAERSEEIQGKVKTKVVPQMKSTLWRNRASDSFITVGRTGTGASTSSRKSIKPMVKTKLKSSISQRIPKPKCSSSLNKDEDAISIPKKVISVATQGDVPSNNDHCNQSTSVAQKKSNRRRSYTSLLIAGSKLMDRYSDVKEDKLPSIDDGSNQLEVAEYVDEIYQFYWVMEAQNPLLAKYMSIQKDITPQMRGILVNWLIEVHFKFDLMQETLYLMITLLDMYLSQVTIDKSELQLVGLTALLLASKYEDFWHPRVKDLISIAVESYTREQMLGMEKLILKKLKFRLNAPTPYVFMLRFLKAAHSDTKLEHMAFYLIELSLTKYEALNFKPSLLCASALYVARCTLQLSPPWTPLLSKHTRYEVSQIRECAEMILRFQKTARTGPLHVSFEKYMRRDFSSVAAIRPLDMLPQ